MDFVGSLSSLAAGCGVFIRGKGAMDVIDTRVSLGVFCTCKIRGPGHHRYMQILRVGSQGPRQGEIPETMVSRILTSMCIVSSERCPILNCQPSCVFLCLRDGFWIVAAKKKQSKTAYCCALKLEALSLVRAQWPRVRQPQYICML